ncbi:NAD(P)-dependent oxidoreductase [Corynebacterium segmentosum]
MKIAVIAANGRSGQKVVHEALAAGHEVTAIVRGENRSEASDAIIRDIMDITAEDLAGFDAVVDAFGAVQPELLDMHLTSVEHLADILSGTDTHFYVIGGAGSLLVDDHGTKLLDTPDFPDASKPISTAQSKQLDYLRTRDDFVWTFISPAAIYDADGERTGKYTIVAGDAYTEDENGQSTISYADMGVAIVALLEDGGYVRERVNIRY